MTHLNFRAYKKSTKTMLPANSLKAICIHSERLTEEEYDDLIIMQSTGLTDKNGKEIYEGDICVDINQEEFVVNFSDEWSAFLLEKGKDTMVFYPGLQIEIIGNIHENPEIVNP